LESGPTTCHVSSRKVKTFDNVKLPISLPHCYTVLSKDCSSDPKYVVLMRKLSPNTDLKQIKIVTRNHKIVLTPSEHSDRVRITVNGQERPLNQDLELTVRGYPVIRIIKENQQQVKVECLTHGLKLRFDGYVCDIKVPQMSYNKQCGLCGLTNMELKSGFRTNEFLGMTQFRTNEFLTTPEFRTNEFLTTPNVRNLFIKYVTSDCRYTETDDECTGYNSMYNKRTSSMFSPESENEMCDEINCPYKQQSSRMFSDDFFGQSPKWFSDETCDDETCDVFPGKYEHTYGKRPMMMKRNIFEQHQSPKWFSDETCDDETCDEFSGKFDQTYGKRPVLKHKVVERGNQVCVSLERIPQCPVNMQSERKVEKRVPYKCIQRNDPRVWQFESRIRTGERIPEIQRLTPSMIRTEVVPMKCNQFY